MLAYSVRHGTGSVGEPGRGRAGRGQPSREWAVHRWASRERALGLRSRRFRDTIPLLTICRLQTAISYRYPTGGIIGIKQESRSTTKQAVDLLLRAGDPARIRTADTRFRKPVLYPLSYGAMRKLF